MAWLSLRGCRRQYGTNSWQVVQGRISPVLTWGTPTPCPVPRPAQLPGTYRPPQPPLSLWNSVPLQEPKAANQLCIPGQITLPL